MRIGRRHLLARLEQLLLIAIIGLIIAHILGQFLAYYAPGVAKGYWMEGIIWHFDMDHESNTQTWFAQALLLFDAAFALLIARAVKLKQRLAWILICLITSLIAIDEFTQSHEVILQNIHGRAGIVGPSTLTANAWYYILPFVGLGLLVGGWYLWRKLPHQTVRQLVIAALVFISGAGGVEVLSSAFTDMTFLKNGLLVALEEGLELVGSWLLLRALHNYTKAYVPNLQRHLKRL